MAEEQREEARERALRFTDVRDQRGRLLFRISAQGVVQIKSGDRVILVDIWEFLENSPEPG